MGCYVYHAISMSFLLQLLPAMAMKPVDSQKKTERTIFGNPIQKTLQPMSITCGHPDIITIVDLAKYQQWNYHINENIKQKEAMMRGSETVYFHPHTNMVFSCDTHGSFIFDFDSDNGKSFYAPTYAITSGCFSKENPLLFMADKEKLIIYNYITETQRFIPLKHTMSIIFAVPFKDNNFFVCSDVKKNIYQIKVGKKNYKEKKLFSLHKKGFTFDENHWAYNDVASLLCLINKRDRGLHIFDIKNSKSKPYVHDDDFPIVNMMFHPTNKMILTLLSQNRRRIEYVDLSNFKKICPVFATRHKTLGGRNIPDLLTSDQKMAFSRDGEHLFVSVGATIFNVRVPFLIAHKPNLAKYKLICFLPFPHDLQKLLLWYLLLVHKGKQE